MRNWVLFVLFVLCVVVAPAIEAGVVDFFHRDRGRKLRKWLVVTECLIKRLIVLSK